MPRSSTPRSRGKSVGYLNPRHANLTSAKSAKEIKSSAKSSLNQAHFEPSLLKLFNEINLKHFSGKLPVPLLQWNTRLRASAGRFTPGRRSLWNSRPPLIEIASYLLEEKNALVHIEDTLAHEMIHYWLWVRRRPYGHTPEFWEKMKLMGVSRYNPVPRRRPFKYLYRCPNCAQEYPARKKINTLACARCCKIYNRGYFHQRFKLVLFKTFESS